MDGRRPEAGDHENADFEYLPTNLDHVTAGFDASKSAQAPEGAQRFPRRSDKDGVPKESLADRLRRAGNKGE
jgi:hypothetical protein